MPKRRKLEGRHICKCECGGEVRGIKDFGRLFTWCEKCTPVEKIKPLADHDLAYTNPRAYNQFI